MRQGCDDEYGQTVETPENENCDGSARDEVEPTRWRPTPAPNTGAEHRRRAHRVALAEQPLRWGTILVLARASFAFGACWSCARRSRSSASFHKGLSAVDVTSCGE